MAIEQEQYPIRLSVDYPEQSDKASTLFRIFLIIPVLVVQSAMSAMLTLPPLLMILFREKYPRWWFDWNLELLRFSARIVAYLSLLTDEYPSTDEEQSIHLDMDYPNAEVELNRWLPLVKWLLAIPHFIVLFVLGIVAVFAVIFAWFAILFTGRYPRGLFDYVVGVARWGYRVDGYAVLMVTDRYPPIDFS